jgi:hypothetical protein
VKKKWKFRLGNDTRYNLKQHLGEMEDYIIFDIINGQKEIAGFVTDGWLTILKGYEWDGCTPKISLFGRLVGVPDFKGTYLASLVHDFLIEFCRQHSINRKQIDIVFQKILQEQKFVLSPIYSSGVHLFRPITLKFGPCK